MFDICEQMAEALSSYMEAEASPVQSSVSGLDRKTIEANLAVCTYCGALRPRTSATPKRGQVPAPPPRVWEGIESALRENGLIKD